ncbi:MAG TPA: ABC transporter substrate-binding protein [Burkholderiaceae bacterium]|nr:ABC transporter substrate-binding protein [Burkholderiaceae bacterium]
MRCIRLVVTAVIVALAVATGAARARTVDVVSGDGFPGQAAVEQGIKDALANSGLTRLKHFNLNFRTLADGDAATQGVRDVAARKPDVIVAVGLAAARAAKAATATIPIVYVIVGDPVAAGLVDTQDASATNLTGVVDATDAQTRVTLIKQLIPGARRVGMVYDPRHEDSAALVKHLRGMLPGDDMTLVDAVATRQADVGAAARSLVDKVDAIYTDNDAIVESTYGMLVGLCDMMKIPLIASNVSDVKRGAVAAVGIDYHGLGMHAGKIAARILRGARPGNIPTVAVATPAIYVNLSAAAKQGVKLPDTVLASARVVVH